MTIPRTCRQAFMDGLSAAKEGTTPDHNPLQIIDPLALAYFGGYFSQNPPLPPR